MKSNRIDKLFVKNSKKTLNNKLTSTTHGNKTIDEFVCHLSTMIHVILENIIATAFSDSTALKTYTAKASRKT